MYIRRQEKRRERVGEWEDRVARGQWVNEKEKRSGQKS